MMEVLNLLSESGPLAILGCVGMYIIYNLAKQALDNNAATVAALNANTAALNRLAGKMDKEDSNG